MTVLDRLIPRFVTGPRRAYFLSGWVSSTLAMWIVWSIELANVGSKETGLWVGIIVAAPILGWVASMILYPLWAVLCPKRSEPDSDEPPQKAA